MKGYKQVRTLIALMTDRESQQSTDYIYNITEQVAEREETDPRGLDPLQNTVDTDALTQLVDSTTGNDIAIGFSYHGYYVTVNGNGSISVHNVSHHILVN